MQTLISENFAFDAALYFLDGHYLFKYVEENAVRSKFISHADVVSAFSKQEVDSGWLQAGIMRTGHNKKGSWFIYTAPPQVVTITTASGSLTVPIPTTVLLGIGKAYYLWALKRAAEPGEKLFHAPCPNVHPDGQICWGSNPIRTAEPGIAPNVWGLFFSSPFNKDLITGKSQNCPENVLEQLENLANAGAKKYPLIDLVPAARNNRNFRLMDAVERLVGA